jgi:hypothetical protein
MIPCKPRQTFFQIDQDVFNAKATIKNITQNALVDAMLQGTINLANLFLSN